MLPLDSLQERLGIRFNRPYLLARALTHRSYLNEHPDVLEDNERLEFLGDAVLDFLTGAWLYRRFPEMTEGQLTRLRAALVRTKQLAEFGADLGLSEALRLGKGEEESGGRGRDTLLCATFEAIVGALYVDSGLEPVTAFVEPFFSQTVDRILHLQADVDPRSLLQEWSQAQYGEIPIYQTLEEGGPDHDKTFTVEVRIGGESYGTGLGRSKQTAALAAAEAALSRAGLA